ncbi:hypothetical protein [Methanoplanus limicola]|uniref:hypothetical protein n=1 Tax=Methanoplanus limicola TaxID=2315 RepID=UPI0012F69ADC|nr:hypothetical protein [Methanoplanus limicola]
MDSFLNAGYDVILSAGKSGENSIGSNCGQYVEKLKKGISPAEKCYTYNIKEI